MTKRLRQSCGESPRALAERLSHVAWEAAAARMDPGHPLLLVGHEVREWFAFGYMTAAEECVDEKPRGRRQGSK